MIRTLCAAAALPPSPCAEEAGAGQARGRAASVSASACRSEDGIAVGAPLNGRPQTQVAHP